MKKDDNIFIKQMNSVGRTGDCIILHFIMSDDSVFSCWLDKFHFNVMKSVGVLGNGNLDFHNGDSFDVDTTDISVLRSAVWLVANGHLGKFVNNDWKSISKRTINIALKAA